MSDSARNYIDTLNSMFIEVKPGLPYDELPRIIKNYTVGVVLYNGHIPNYIYNAPNKLFEYLACGLDVWLPQTMIGSLPYVTQNSYPKVTALDFTTLPEFDLYSGIDRTGLHFKPTTFFCEDVLIEITKLLFKDD